MDWNATHLPSGVTAVSQLFPFPCAPPVATLTRVVVGCAPASAGTQNARTRTDTGDLFGRIDGF